jgi:hypothetical protein
MPKANQRLRVVVEDLFDIGVRQSQPLKSLKFFGI